MSLLVFSQYLGGSVLLTLANTVFSTSLASELPRDAPGVNVTAVIAAGASGVEQAVPPALVPGVLQAYTTSVDRVFYMTIGCAGGFFISAFFMGWKNIKPKAASPDQEKGQAALTEP